MLPKNPFTLAFGKEPISYITRGIMDQEIIQSFEDERLLRVFHSVPHQADSERYRLCPGARLAGLYPAPVPGVRGEDEMKAPQQGKQRNTAFCAFGSIRHILVECPFLHQLHECLDHLGVKLGAGSFLNF